MKSSSMNTGGIAVQKILRLKAVTVHLKVDL
jgi:hypothetical protein